MAKQQVTGYTRYENGKSIKVPSYPRKKRKRSGKGKLFKKPIRFRPKRAVRDKFTGEIIGWK